MVAARPLWAAPERTSRRAQWTICRCPLADPSHSDAQALIERLRLQPHPEGGWFREEHRSPLSVCRTDGAHRSALTLIWFLLREGEISRWHRVRGGDETWHHAGGDPLELWLLAPEGGMAQRRCLGPLTSLRSAAAPEDADHPQPVRVVPANWWQAARSQGAWSLLTCCVGPGFDFQDFQLLCDLPPEQRPSGARADLL